MKELDVVRLVQEFQGFPVGTEGTIVHKYDDSMYEVEFFSKDGDTIWKCRNCGHIVIGKNAPEICPVCAHPKAYFEIKAENYFFN